MAVAQSNNRSLGRVSVISKAEEAAAVTTDERLATRVRDVPFSLPAAVALTRHHHHRLLTKDHWYYASSSAARYFHLQRKHVGIGTLFPLRRRSRNKRDCLCALLFDICKGLFFFLFTAPPRPCHYCYGARVLFVDVVSVGRRKIAFFPRFCF